MKLIVLIDYGSGNLHSAQKAFEFAATQTGLDYEVLTTSDPETVRRADRIILPGVGAFAACRRGLYGVPGMVEAMSEAVQQRGRPFMGICVGMQLMAERGLEYETQPGLGWIAGDVVKIRQNDPELKIPHMGWNTLSFARHHPILEGLPTGENGLHAYYVHSFHMQMHDRNALIAECDYGGPLTAIVGRDSMVGLQFHPEKSQTFGLGLLSNFLRWNP